jgi:hypothetical protein
MQRWITVKISRISIQHCGLMQNGAFSLVAKPGITTAAIAIILGQMELK